MRVSPLWVAISIGGCLFSAEGSESNDREILFERIRSWQAFPERMPLEAVVEALSGCRVLDWQGEQLEGLTRIADAVLQRVRATPLSAARPNEVGYRLETVVSAAIRELDWPVDRPAGPSGRRRSAGYPDLEFMAGGRAFYLEIKAFSPGTERSTQRTFYLSPSDDFKVTRDAFHLLLACEIVAEGEDTYRLQSVKWLDLSRLEVRLKHEFNASNRDLYGEDAGLVILETPANTGPDSALIENKP